MIDDELVESASRALGTRGIKATIDRALISAIEQQARREAVEQLRRMDGLDLDDEEVMRSAWR